MFNIGKIQYFHYSNQLYVIFQALLNFSDTDYFIQYRENTACRFLKKTIIEIFNNF